jgi:hypothetical protein
MTPKIGQLFSHTFLDGLYILLYKSDYRYGLRSIDTGKMRYINRDSFQSQYTFLT